LSPSFQRRAGSRRRQARHSTGITKLVAEVLADMKKSKEIPQEPLSLRSSAATSRSACCRNNTASSQWRPPRLATPDAWAPAALGRSSYVLLPTDARRQPFDVLATA
jgi:hypothetical protein